ncbi:hypothetical protein JCM8547_005464 [Rhodosporidiobolus lusitaniae]
MLLLRRLTLLLSIVPALARPSPSFFSLSPRHTAVAGPSHRLSRRSPSESGSASTSGCGKSHVLAPGWSTSSSGAATGAVQTSASVEVPSIGAASYSHSRTRTRTFGSPTSSSSRLSSFAALPTSYSSSSSKCGDSGATNETTTSSGPNGSEAWLNCGLSSSSPSSGWTPPSLSLDSVATISLSEALSMSNSVYSACSSYQDLFEKYAEKEGLPGVLLAAFAMQESSCDASTVGDSGGAFGLMQITEDKCGSAPSRDCSNPEYNIKTAAAYFSTVLAEHDGNLLLALGSYNGWYKGMTYQEATAAASGDCCECQQNLDYHHQMLNGWLLGLDGSTLGTLRNLDVCSS